jgi:hypothetical protein
MDRLARGSLVKIPVPLDKKPEGSRREAACPESLASREVTTAGVPKQECDLASACPQCGTMMEPEHAHYRCKKCGYRDSCCF